jgi:hypothetical protein
VTFKGSYHKGNQTLTIDPRRSEVHEGHQLLGEHLHCLGELLRLPGFTDEVQVANYRAQRGKLKGYRKSNGGLRSPREQQNPEKGIRGGERSPAIVPA